MWTLTHICHIKSPPLFYSAAVTTAFSDPAHENAQPVEQFSLHDEVQFVVQILEHCALQLVHVNEHPEQEFLHAP